METIQTNLLNHPAIKAWEQLYPEGPQPKGFAVLRERKSAKEKKTAVYKIDGIGLAGSGVIAKRCRKETALVERTIYTEILPHLAIPALHYYGFLEEREGSFCWLFLEDAGSKKYKLDFDLHRVLIAQWLGSMHTSAASVAAAVSLPDRGPNHYLMQMERARDAIRHIMADSALEVQDRTVLGEILSTCSFLEMHWGQLAAFCEQMPRTLVHGDFAEKNGRVRPSLSRSDLVLFDWELAGWGVPAIDLHYFTRSHLAASELPAYWRVIQERWPHLTLKDIDTLVKVGAIFRRLDGLQWEVHTFIGGSVVIGLGRNLAIYQSRLANAIRAIEWND
jgi:hypothetical protein